jgi:transcriptional regulator with XRE-family HTH domain
MKTLGARLKAARIAADLTQGELGVACGWGADVIEAQGRISNYERDLREPTIADLKTMARVLKCDPIILAFGHPLEPDPEEEKILLAYRFAGETGKRMLRYAAESIVEERRSARRRTNNKIK